MRQPQHKNRMRARNRRQPNPINRIYESNGPDVKIRGTAQHVAEKYMQLGRDALSSGDEIKAESYFQHAEHYYRIIAAAQEQIQQRRQQQQEQREQRMRGNGRSRSMQQPVAEMPAPESPPALPAPGNGSDGDNGASHAQESTAETALESANAGTLDMVTVIDVSDAPAETTDDSPHADGEGNGATTTEPVVQVMDLTGGEAVAESEAKATDGNGKDTEAATLEAAEDWGGNPPGFLMQPVTIASASDESEPKVDDGNSSTSEKDNSVPAADDHPEAEATSEEKAIDTEEKPKRTRRTRTARTTRRTRRTSRKSASADETSTSSDSAS